MYKNFSLFLGLTPNSESVLSTVVHCHWLTFDGSSEGMPRWWNLSLSRSFFIVNTLENCLFRMSALLLLSLTSCHPQIENNNFFYHSLNSLESFITDSELLPWNVRTSIECFCTQTFTHSIYYKSADTQLSDSYNLKLEYQILVSGYNNLLSKPTVFFDWVLQVWKDYWFEPTTWNWVSDVWTEISHWTENKMEGFVDMRSIVVRFTPFLTFKCHFSDSSMTVYWPNNILDLFL